MPVPDIMNELPVEVIEQHRAPFKGLPYDFGHDDRSQGWPKGLVVLRSWDTPRLEKERFEMLRASFNKMFGHNAQTCLDLVEKVLAERKIIESEVAF